MERFRSRLLRLGLGLAVIGAFILALLPARGRVDDLAVGAVLVVPVAFSATLGWATGFVAVLATFLLYDLIYVPQYGVLTMRNPASAIPLAVYAAVFAIVAPLAPRLSGARRDARRATIEAHRLSNLIEALTGDRPLPEMLGDIVSFVREAFEVESVELLLASGADYEVAARAGVPLSPEERRIAAPSAGAARSLSGVTAGERQLVGLPLAATGEPIGLLVLAGAAISPEELGTVRVYANQAAFAIERGRLREAALETELLRQVDHLRSSMLGAVSHDLRTPLASVKAAVSDLRSTEVELSPADRAELLELIEVQTGRLDRLVANLLDMTRIEFGELKPRLAPATIEALLGEALESFATVVKERVKQELPADLPQVLVDHVLICQVFANLIENAERYGAEGTPIVVEGREIDGRVEVSVEDEGPGVPAADRDRVFKMFNRISGGGRAGIGLSIVETFLAAHGQSIRIDDRPGGGARFVFGLPIAAAFRGSEQK